MWDAIYHQIVFTAAISAAFTVIFALVLGTIAFGLKKSGKTSYSFSIQRGVLPCLFMIYLLTVLGLTLFTRSGTMGNADLHWFSSYRNAWNRFSADSWKMPLYNILMFVPLGVFLPLLHPSFNRLWKLLIWAAAMTLMIETVQLLTSTGVFEVDDLMNNFIGAWIGWGLIKTVLLLPQLYKGPDRKSIVKKIFFALLPFLIVVSLISAIFWRYHHQPYGNFENAWIYRLDLSETVFQAETALDAQESMAWVYLRVHFTPREMEIYAEKILEKLNLEIMPVLETSSDQVVLGKDGKKITVFPDGQFELELAEAALAFERQAALTLVNQLGFELKEELSVYSTASQTWVTIPFSSKANPATNGTAVLEATETLELAFFGWHVRLANRVEQVKIKSAQEAFEAVKRGEFRWNHEEEIRTLTLLEYALVYQRDTKNFYQPVWQFTVRINENTTMYLLIPAVK